MSVIPSSIVVGAFRSRLSAEQTMEALYDAGFTREQMQYIASGTGGFFEGIKSFFAGTGPSEENLPDTLTNMGLSNEEVRYYSGEYERGNTILAVVASGREQEALGILRQYDAYNAREISRTAVAATSEARQPSDYAQQGNEQAPLSPGYSTTPEYAHTYEASMYQNNQGEEVETPVDQAHVNMPETDEIEEVEAPEDQAKVDTTGEEGSDETGSAGVPENQASMDMPEVEEMENLEEVETPEGQARVDTPEVEEVDEVETPVYQASAVTLEVNEMEEMEMPENQASVDTSGMERIDEMDEVATPAYPADAATPQQDDITTTPQSGATFADSSNRLQQLLDQIEATRQQLEDTKAQLEVAKQHEVQITEAQQQLKDLQEELQKVQAELTETKGRLGLA